MVRKFRSDAQRKAVMSALARQRDKLSDYRRMTISQRLLVGVRKVKDPVHIDKFFQQFHVDTPNYHISSDADMGYIKNTGKPVDSAVGGQIDRLLKSATSVIDFRQVPKSVFKDGTALMLVNSSGEIAYINRKYLRYIKTYLGDDVYAQFSGEAHANSPVFFVDRNTRSAIAIAPVYSRRLGLYGVQYDIARSF